MNNVVNDARQIVCIVPKGQGQKLVDAVSEEHEAFNANYHHARGVGRSTRVGKGGLGEQQEKDVFSITVDHESADEIFKFLYFKAGIDEAHGGMIYMQACPKTTILEMPSLES